MVYLPTFPPSLQLEKIRSYIRPSSPPKPKDSNFWDAALDELSQGWNDLRTEAMRLRNSIVEAVHENELISVIWTLFTAWEVG